MGIIHKLTTPRWPRVNVEVERQNHSLLKTMRAAHTKRNWRTDLNKYLLAYRSTAHITTGKTPAELLYGQNLSTKLPDIGETNEAEDNTLQQQVKGHDAEKKQGTANYADKIQQAPDREMGTRHLVLLEKKKENKLSAPYKSEPYKVTACYGDQLLLLQKYSITIYSLVFSEILSAYIN